MTELIRYLLRSSRACYYTEEATILHNAFVNRGYLSETFFQVLRKVDWTARDSFRRCALEPKNKEAPCGGIIFTTSIDPQIVAAIENGAKVDLSCLRNTSTVKMSTQDQQTLGCDLTSIIPQNGMIALKAARKLQNLFGWRKNT